MSEKVIKNWLDLAEYDFKTARAMMKSGRYLYVAFTCQQTIEEETNSFLEILNSYYIQSRYTEEIHQISKSLNKKSAQEILSKTGELFKWLKNKM